MKITTSLDIADFVVGKDQRIINEYGPDWSENIERDIADWIDKEERKLMELSDNLLSIDIEFEDDNLCLSIDTYDKPLEYIFLNDVEEFKKEIEKLQAEWYHNAIKEYHVSGWQSPVPRLSMTAHKRSWGDSFCYPMTGSCSLMYFLTTCR